MGASSAIGVQRVRARFDTRRHEVSGPASNDPDAGVDGVRCCHIDPGEFTALINAAEFAGQVDVPLGEFALVMFATRGMVTLGFGGDGTLGQPGSTVRTVGEHARMPQLDARADRHLAVCVFVAGDDRRRDESSVLSPRTEAAAILGIAGVRAGCGKASNPAPEHASVTARRQRAMVEAGMAIYRARLGRPPSVDEIARSFATSRAVITEAFREQLGMTPAQFGRRTRMAWASAAIQARARPIAQIADRVGYANPAAFSRAFRAYFGHTPSDHIVNRRAILTA